MIFFFRCQQRESRNFTPKGVHKYFQRAFKVVLLINFYCYNVSSKLSPLLLYCDYISQGLNFASKILAKFSKFYLRISVKKRKILEIKEGGKLAKSNPPWRLCEQNYCEIKSLQKCFMQGLYTIQ